MSTLSFQEYVRERMLRKRRAALANEGLPTPEPEAPQPARAARRSRLRWHPNARPLSHRPW
ncbi:MAG: hypothetical protein R3E42_19830 [Burkholderiaceae bacterium]